MVTVTAGAPQRPSTPSSPPLEPIGIGMARCPHCGGPVPTQNRNLAVKSERSVEGGIMREYGWTCMQCSQVVS